MQLFTNSKYTRWYLQLIEKARNRNTLLGYSEKHHVVPKSLGGLNRKSNIVHLTAREHFICHVLLCKMTVGQAQLKMLYAFNMLSSARSKTHQHGRDKLNSHKYAKLKLLFIEKHRAMMLAKPLATRKLFGKQSLGYKHTPLSRQLISEGNTGKIISDETRAKISEAHLRLKKKLTVEQKDHLRKISSQHRHSDETKLKISQRTMGRVISEETRKRMSLAKQDRVVSNETRRKMSEAKLGKKQSLTMIKKRMTSLKQTLEKLGVQNSAQLPGIGAKISAAKLGKPSPHLGKTRSEETKRKMSEARKAYWAAKRLANGD